MSARRGEREIPVFDRESRGDEREFCVIGGGEIGGKAAGLDRVRREILDGLEPWEFPGFEVAVPTMTVLTTEVFDAFMHHNRLWEVALGDEPDDRLALLFQQADMPAVYLGDLRSLVQRERTPLAVRSSSLLEDQLDHPLAGVYATKMIPNNQPDADTRFRRLVEAIKFVYASTFFRASRDYLASIGQDPASEKMAVIVQDLVGRRRDQRFYPTLSGVARSYNYYPVGKACCEDGVADLALGLGKMIVDGGRCWTYSPAYPRKPMPFGSPVELLRSTQTQFWAVNMGRPPAHDPIRETEYMELHQLREAEYDDTLRFVASTLDSRSDRLVPGTGYEGPRAIDFAPILTATDIPLNGLVRRLLQLSEETLGAAVEMEFAVDLDTRRGLPARFGFLQVRPMAVSEEHVTIDDEQLEGDDVVLASSWVLGNGVMADVRDVVFVKPDVFDPSQSLEIAGEVGGHNQLLSEQGRAYALIGPGRWGSSDSWLGIPVDYSQISGARIVVESSLPGMQPDFSQGSHFFQNLIAFSVLYFSCRHDGAHPVDWEWLMAQPAEDEGRFTRRVRLARPLWIGADGRRGRGVIRRHE